MGRVSMVIQKRWRRIGHELLRDRLFQLGLSARLLISFRVPLTAQEQTYLVLILSIDDPAYR